MHLKALEIQGFKSFPEKTVIAFDEGVTAIIGPNGSGKSNVTDAIRWVLGEQSIKTLRGARMEDVIFTGTQSRRAMSFAEVTMVIDNTDGRLPLDYSEIQITRRLYRSGESEYLLNKTTCRLRDISRLFMDTGLGRDGYSIVGQGRVDEILSHRSEERRRIFEEASGIVKYKTRKEESERKLQGTEQNLIRINDLIAELESRLEPLAEQADAARQYQTLSEKLKGEEIALILDQIDQYQQRIDEADSEKNLVLSDLAQANAHLTHIRTENHQTVERLEALDIESQSINQRLAHMNQETHDYQRKLALHSEKIRHLHDQIQLASAEELELSGNIGEFDQEIASRQAKSDTLHKQREVYNAKLKAAEAEMSLLVQTLDASEKKIEADKTHLDELLDKAFDAKSRLGQLDNQIDLVQNRIKAIDKELLERISDLDRLRILQEEKQGAMTQLDVEQTEQNEVYSALKEEIDQQRDRCNSLAKKLETERQELRNQSYRLQMLEKLERNYEGYQQAVRSILKKVDEHPGFGTGIKGTVGSLIYTENRYERAIETALGAAIQNIVTDNQKTAARLIEDLKQTRSGRATFLPLDTLRARPLEKNQITSVQNLPGFVGLASDLVTADPELENVVLYLLGRVVVAEDLNTAMKLSRQSGQTLRLVTLEGDVIAPGGSMTGGYQKQGGSGLLGRARDIETLKVTIESVNASIKAMEQQLKTDETSLNDQAGKLAQIEQNRLERSHERIRLEAQIASVSEEQKKTASQREILVSDQQQLNQQLTQIQADKESILQNIASMEQTLANLRQSISEQEGSSREDRLKRDDLRETVTEWRVSLQSIEESIQAAEEMINRIEQDRLSRTGRLTRRRQDQVEYQDEINRLQKEQVEDTQNLDQLQKNETELSHQAQQLFEEKSRLEGEQNSFFEKLESATSRIASLQGEISRIEAKASRYEGQIDDAKNRLWEFYELTADQAEQWKQPSLNRSETTKHVNLLKNQIKELGPVNIGAIDEHIAVRNRYAFITKQRDDIEQARHQLTSVIDGLIQEMKKQFMAHFRLINENFCQVFSELFGGGTAEVNLEDESDVLNCGIEIKAQPPGKKLQNLLLLSGGERSLTAIALLFAILKLRPTPFCVLDEVEASLDDANVIRFTEYIRRYSHESQFILVTHRKGTMEAADRLYGVTMPERGISRILSMKLTD